MSISTLQSYNWFQTLSPQTSGGISQIAASVPSGLPGQAASTGGASSFQQLVADVQAVINSRTTASTGASGTLAGGTSVSDPAQNLVTDLQSIYNQIETDQNGSGQNDAVASSGQSGSGEERSVRAHHHHHHAAGGSSGATASTGASATPTASAQSVSQVLAASLTQALQAYASSGSSTTVTGSTV